MSSLIHVAGRKVFARIKKNIYNVSFLNRLVPLQSYLLRYEIGDLRGKRRNKENAAPLHS